VKRRGGRNQKRGHKKNLSIKEKKASLKMRKNGKKINGCVYLKLIINIQMKKKNK
jgi:hypothetical protein